MHSDMTYRVPSISWKGKYESLLRGTGRNFILIVIGLHVLE